ncbi:MAG: DNA translocase FtsK [Chloroflexi bacterium]|nr:DNA translocase FtsK [Chloroflexota bacterium]
MPADRTKTGASGAGRPAARATTTRPAARPGRGAARSRRTPTPGAAAVARAPLPATVRRDLAVLALLVIALLSVLSLVLPEAPMPLRLWRDSLLLVFGRGAPLAPAALLLLAAGLLPGMERLRPGPGQVVGAALAVVTGLGLLHLSVAAGEPTVALGDGGGLIGGFVATVLTAALTGAGALLVLLAGLLAGLVLVAGLTLPALGQAAGWVLARLAVAVTWLGRGAVALVAGAGALRWQRTPRRTLAEEYAATVRRRDEAGRASGRRISTDTPEALPVVAPPPPEPRLIVPETGPRRPDVASQPSAASALWRLPAVDLLDTYPEATPDTGDAQQKARVIDATLTSFKVDARVREIYAGPSFTQFAVEPGEGVKVRRITELHNDLALALAVPSLRIEAPVPGKARVGIEIPNGAVATVGLRETLESDEWAGARARLKLPLVLGRDVSGRPVVVDMARMPHLLIAGATGAGKSVCLNAVIACLLLHFAPDELRMVMIDPKRVELSSYNGIPHLQAPVVTEMDKVVGLLRKVVQEMEQRYDLLQRLGVRNLDGYLKRCDQEPRLERLSYLLVIVDELADLMMTAPDEVEGLLCRLAQMGRATGIHLILATQRPSVDVVTGLIKANFPSRIAFAVSSQIDSRVILDSPGAERLMGRGDMLYQAADAPKPQRIQGVYLSDGNIEKIVEYWRGQSAAPAFDPAWENPPAATVGEAASGDDELYDQALALVREHGVASASMLQRRLRVGYNRAARLIETLEARGVIGPVQGRMRTVIDGEAADPSPAPPPSRSDDDLPL